LSLVLAIGFASSFTPEEEAVFEKAQKSLEANQNKTSIGSNFVQTAINKSGTGGLVSTNTYSYYDIGGNFYVTGEVLNRTPDAMQNIVAHIDFYDSKKNIIDTATDNAYPPLVNSGQKGAFAVYGTGPTQAKKVSSFKITLDGDYAGTKPPGLKVKVGNTDNTGIGYHVVGEITNTGPDDSTFTGVYCVFYDKAGRVLETVPSYLAEIAQTELAPRQSTSFELIAFNAPEKVKSFKVYADSDQYSSFS
jgi:hypothetical protein